MPAQAMADRFNELGIEFQEYTHEAFHSADTAQEECEAMGIPVVKNIVLKTKKSPRKYMMITLPGHKRCGKDLLESLCGERHCSFVSGDELKEMLNVEAGSCSAFGLIHDTEKKLDFWLDAELLQFDKIGLHPNDNTKTWVIKTSDFRKYIESLGRDWKSVEIH